MSADPIAPVHEAPPTEPSAAVASPAWFRRGAWLVFLAALLSMAAVHHRDPGWNANTRFALVFAVAEGTLSIDKWHGAPETETGDKAFFEGRYYSDKIFGVSLLALPVHLATKVLAGGDPPFQVSNYVLRLWAVSVPAAAAVALLWMLMVRLGAGPRKALALAAFAFWGSLWYGYSTAFLPYSTGIACILGALWIAFFPRAHRVTFANAAAIGLLAGYAVLCDMIFAPASGLVGVVLAMRLLDQGGFFGMRAFAHMMGERSNGRTCAAMLAASGVCAAVPVALFAAYCVAIFGKATIPYEFEHDPLFREGMQQGFMGVKAPSLHHAWFLTLHPFRGIVFWSPWVLVALGGAVAWIRGVGKRRICGWLAVVAAVFYLLFNAGYYMWWGGWCMGPRLMLPAMAFVPVALALIGHERAPKGLWWTTVALGTAAVVLNMPVALIEPQTPQGNPTELLLDVRIGDGLAVPQFAFWRAFFSPEMYAEKPLLVLSHAASAALPLAILILAGRIVPRRHEAFEDAELPFVQYDGRGTPLGAPTPKDIDVPM